MNQIKLIFFFIISINLSSIFMYSIHYYVLVKQNVVDKGHSYFFTMMMIICFLHLILLNFFCLKTKY